jgi:hypothetical protein
MVAEPSLSIHWGERVAEQDRSEFGLAGTVLALALIVWLALVVPIRGCRNHRLIAIRDGDPAALGGKYRRSIVQRWLTVGAAVVIVAVSPGVSL